MKYSCYDWYGNKKADNIDNLKDAAKPYETIVE